MWTKLSIFSRNLILGIIVSILVVIIDNAIGIQEYFEKQVLVEGEWSGHFIENSLQVVSVMRIKSSDDSIRGTMVENRIGKNGNSVVVKSFLRVTRQDKKVTIIKCAGKNNKSSEVVFFGTLSDDGHVLDGTWKSENGYGDFRFIRDN
ncbi:hypothetical protein [Desulfolutivibrio sulfoxidireducens]|uniref:hypothetical protein n=1 Tax=Desulfolutivibrio sulfoxidireducens TaxID=2773299 RepID=UPI00159E3842|nr:hypothetical protein [Desulfolutivibrio sulfoxidireducens]QLA19404.1 hypothetical protein GD604_06425 [Desulfolutivibrio sulfoxidireducens]